MFVMGNAHSVFWALASTYVFMSLGMLFTAAVFAGGRLEETRALLDRSGGVLPDRVPIGYVEAAACLRGEISRPEAVRRVEVAHRRYARRQVIWLRKERGVEWISPPVDVAALARRVERG